MISFLLNSLNPTIEENLNKRDFLDFMTFWLNNNHKESIVEKFFLKLSMDSPQSILVIKTKCHVKFGKSLLSAFLLWLGFNGFNKKRSLNSMFVVFSHMCNQHLEWMDVLAASLKGRKEMMMRSKDQLGNKLSLSKLSAIAS